MAGSGGSDYRDSLGSARGRDSEPDCATLSFLAPLMSPDPEVAPTIEVGTVCDIVLEGTPRQLAVYTRDTGGLLGAITERWADLTRCIDAGYEYEAGVTAIDPIRLRIRPRAS